MNKHYEEDGRYTEKEAIALFGNNISKLTKITCYRENEYWSSKKNAMALLAPFADETYANTGIAALEKDLDNKLKKAEEFHKNFKVRMRNLEDRYGKENIEMKPIEFDYQKSKIIIKHKGKEYEASYYEIA